MFKKLIASLLLFSVIFGLSLSTVPTPAKAQWQDLITALSNPNNRGVTVFCLWLDVLRTPPLNLISGQFPEWIAEDRDWYDQSICQFNDKVFNSPPDQLFGERYTYAQFTWIINSMASYLINFLFATNPVTGLFADVTHQSNLASSGGAVGIAINMMGQMQTNQVSFFHSVLPEFLSRFDLASPATAQGYGFQTLSGIQSLWGATRNMSYLIMIVILIVSGFMIMFKVKINPQTAVTIQVMIPKILTTLLGITFSYAIAGLVIDLIYVFLGFIIYLLPMGAGGIFANAADQANAFAFFTTPDFAQVYNYYNAFTLPASFILGFLIPGVGVFVLPILFAILLFKAFWAMLRAYIMLIVNVITAPLQILRGLLPNQAGFSQWLRNIVAYSTVFFVVPIMLLLNMAIWAGGTVGDILNGLADIFGDPFIQGIDFTTLPNLPLFGNGNNTGGSFGAEVIQLAMGYALLSMIPSTIDKVIEAFKAVKIGDTGDIIGDLQTAALLSRNSGLPTTGGASGAGAAWRGMRNVGARAAGAARNNPTQPAPSRSTP